MQFAVRSYEAEAVARRERRCFGRERAEKEGAAFHPFGPADLWPRSLGRVEGVDGLRGAAVGKVFRETAVETAAHVGREGQFGVAVGSAHIVGTAAVQDAVQLAAVPRRHVFHVLHVLQPSLNLERAHPSVHHLLEQRGAVHVAQREQVLFLDEFASRRVLEVEGQAAELCAAAPVGRAAKAVLRSVAASAEAHAERAVDEGLERHTDRIGDASRLGQTRFAGQNNLAEASRLEPLRLFGRAVVHLRRGVERDGRQL